MQTVSANLQAELDKGPLEPRILIDLVELYESDYVPGVDGFDPADAIETFASVELTWNGIAYRRELAAGGGRGDITRAMGEKTNSVTLNFSNVSRYMATLAQTQVLEGLFCVIRCVCPTVTDDSIVLFVGRCDKPSDIDKGQFTMSARQDFGNINQELPPRRFVADDPEGRTASDPLYEGFRILSTSGSFIRDVTEASTSFFGRLFGRKKTSKQTEQYSSIDNTPYGEVVPMQFGRVQVELVCIYFIDEGYNLGGVWVIGEGRVDDAIVKVHSDYLQQTEVNRLGDIGGTGDNATIELRNKSYFSRTAYTLRSMYGSPGDVVEDPPLVTAIVRGIRVPLPNSSGVFGADAWTDNGVYIARFILTDPRLVNIDPAFMEDSVNYATGLHCDEPLIDETSSQLIPIPDADLLEAGDGFIRLRSTGQINPRSVLYNYLGDTSIVPELVDGPYEGFDPLDPPLVFTSQPLLRKRYTTNIPFTDSIKAVDALYKVIFPSFKGFLRVNKRGKYEIRSEKATDHSYLRSATAVGATSIAIQDVTPWKSGDLLIGRLLLGFNLLASEVRNISSAVYSADGNALTLTAGVTGTITATASGATLSGGSTTVQASGTVTIGGTPAAGNIVTITINGVAVSYTLSAEDTTSTVASLLASWINATPRLRPYIRAFWVVGSPTVVTIKCLYGALTLDSALLKVHAGPVVDPTVAPTVAASSGGSLPAGTWKLAYSNANSIGSTSLTPLASINITVDQQIDVSGLPAFPAGITARNFFLSDQAGSTNLKFSVQRLDASNFSITDFPEGSAAVPPSFNTTGEELMRVAMSFATNSQDVYPAWTPGTFIINGDTYLPTTPNAHKYQAATSAGAAASGSIALEDNPLNGDTLTINGVVFTFKTSPSGSFEIQIAAGNVLTATNARAVLNASVHASVSVATYAGSGSTITITYDTVGTVGNSFTLAASGDVTLSGATLTGGTSGGDTTGTTEPTWPASGTVNDNGIIWTEVGATVLGQAGLSRANIIKDSFKWPLGSRQSSVNQSRGSYRDPTNDFALTPIRVNDKIHQLQVKKIYPKEVNLEAVDSLHQALRLANADLAKNREGDWFVTFGAGPRALTLEEGDVASVSDDSGGLVNVLVRIEELRIRPNHEVIINQARKYSTNMFSDEVGAQTISLPSTLRLSVTADSIAHFIDSYPIRDEDGLVIGFYISVSRDLAIEGDWRGWALHADYGDGYVQIDSGDIAAFVGTCTTTLTSVADSSVFDHVNTVTFTLEFGPLTPFPNPFGTVTESELLASVRRNLFLIGNEYVQAATITDNGSRSYTLSNLLRGRFGTDTTELTHSASERVVFMNGSEALVAIDPVRLGKEYNYKVVTTNQDVADAAPVPFTWTGGTAKPLPPSSLRGERDSANNLLILWNRRTRIGAGMRPYSDVPIGEQDERYQVEVYDGSTIARLMKPVYTGMALAALLESDGGSKFSGITINTLTQAGTGAIRGRSLTEITQTGNFAEATLICAGTVSVGFGLILGSRAWRGVSSIASADYFAAITTSGPNFFLKFYEAGVEVYSEDANAYATTGVRVRIALSGSEVRFTKEWVGAATPPQYVSPVAPSFPLRVLAEASSTGGTHIAQKIVMTIAPQPATIYTAAQYTQDGLTAGDPTKLRVFQISAIVGRGGYAERTI